MLRWCIPLAFLLIHAGRDAGAQEVCPWLTQGTAATLMGGEVSSTVHVSAGAGTCEFVLIPAAGEGRATSNSHLMLEIAVGREAFKQCAQGERVTGIGEDASSCHSDGPGGRREFVSGRVRKTFFLLSVTSQENGAADQAAQRKLLEQAAEEVAGSLF